MDSLTNLIFGIFIVFIVLLVLREAYCWYAKINERIDLMNKQLAQSKETNRLLTLILEKDAAKDANSLEYKMSEQAAVLELSKDFED